MLLKREEIAKRFPGNGCGRIVAKTVNELITQEKLMFFTDKTEIKLHELYIRSTFGKLAKELTGTYTTSTYEWFMVFDHGK